ncbi:hypothetical protein [Streptomyces sp. NPDC005953]
MRRPKLKLDKQSMNAASLPGAILAAAIGGVASALLLEGLRYLIS